MQKVAERAPGLTLVPEVKSPSCAFVLPGSDAAAFVADRAGSEARLAALAFEGAPEIKIRCAGCLLDGPWANGAAVIVGSRALVEAACAVAGAEAARAVADGEAQHDDHAHHVAALPVDLLRRPDTRARSDAILERLVGGRGLAPRARVELGHHIGAGLSALGDALRPRDEVFAIVYDDDTHYTVNLPGGKRHLAESPWVACLREAKEETSLILDSHGGDADGVGALARARAAPALRFRVVTFGSRESMRFHLLRAEDEADAAEGPPGGVDAVAARLGELDVNAPAWPPAPGVS